jgi:hypothetical protein
MTRKALALALSLGCIATSSNIKQAIAADSKAPSPIDELSKFVGEGTCTGNVMAMGKSPGHATTGKYHGEKTLDGQWIVIHYDEDKTDVNPKPIHVQQFFSYDPEKKMCLVTKIRGRASARVICQVHEATRFPGFQGT